MLAVRCRRVESTRPNEAFRSHTRYTRQENVAAECKVSEHARYNFDKQELSKVVLQCRFDLMLMQDSLDSSSVGYLRGYFGSVITGCWNILSSEKCSSSRCILQWIFDSTFKKLPSVQAHSVSRYCRPQCSFHVKDLTVTITLRWYSQHLSHWDLRKMRGALPPGCKFT